MTTPPPPDAPHPAAAPVGANLITVASGKGGVGKTWLAITLAHALAKRGQRILLFDGDLGLANVDVQLGLMPPRDLNGVVSSQAVLADSVQRFAEGGFDIIAGHSGSGALAALDRERLIALRRELLALASAYDRVVVDLGAGVESAVQVLAANAGITLVVATDEPTSLTDAYAFIKVMAKRRPGINVRIVVNMAAGRREGERTYGTLRKACESFLKISPRLAGIVRRDPKVKDAIRHQTAMLIRHPTSAAVKDVEAICARLMPAS